VTAFVHCGAKESVYTHG